MEKIFSSLDSEFLKSLAVGAGVGAGISAGLTIYNKTSENKKPGKMMTKTLNFKYFNDVHNCFADIEFFSKMIEEENRSEWDKCLDQAITNADKALNVIVRYQKDDIPLTPKSLATIEVGVRYAIDTLFYMKKFIPKNESIQKGYDEIFEETNNTLYDIYSNIRGDF